MAKAWARILRQPKASGGDDQEKNLQGICRLCHSHKTSQS
ncbi:HNH endonuclease [Hahella sp. HN01]|nr:HNH endonuclease [Hahella sp. HN01]